jgi:hypothetical protein
MSLPSFHDDYLVGYAVDCEARRITLRIRGPQSGRVSTVEFSGVEGYCFEGDALGNIIFSLERVPVSYILSEFGAQISESVRMSGAPGPWADDLNSANIRFTENSTQGYVLSPSYGMSGWVLAKTVEVVAQPGGAAAQEPPSQPPGRG